MTTPGPIALIGGGEHLEATLALDRRLLELTGAEHPRVVVLPQAPSPGQLAKTVALARNHWTRLGATFGIALAELGVDRAVDELSSADIAVLPGGHPNKLIAGLGASRLTDVLISRWLEGMSVAGSSAGAMGLFEWRIKLYPPNPLALLPGLGLLDGYVAAPHFDRFRADRWAPKAARRLQGQSVLGLDEATGLVGRGQVFEVVGPGCVTSIDASGSTRRFRAGEAVRIDLSTRRTRLLSAGREPDRRSDRVHAVSEPPHRLLAASGSRM